MSFFVDSQTLSDLQIFQSEKGKASIHKIFDHTKTHGGKIRLQEMLGEPTSDIKMIIEREEAIRYFQISGKMPPEMDTYMLDFIEQYLKQANYPTRISKLALFRAWEKALVNRIRPRNEYFIIERGIIYVLEIMKAIHEFALQTLKAPDFCPALLRRYCLVICDFFAQPEYHDISKIGSRLQKRKATKVLKSNRILRFDYMFRYTHKDQVRFFLDFAYECDAFCSVAYSAQNHHFVFPEFSESTERIELEGLFHPFIPHAVTNDVCLTASSNLIFITGPNMAGKSTFLKSIGIAVYLAHIGFPVPAARMSTGVLSGLSTTINLPDELNLGYSHFYSEVRRIKHVVENIQTHRKMLVIFDELFRGTNVKDAYEGSLAIISAFSKVNTCFFAISTHIVEVAKELLADRKNICFYFFDAEEKDGIPAYTYRMKEGITNTRLGMQIIRKEKIIESITQLG
jgi:DNA mismatch repair ATPase MutS